MVPFCFLYKLKLWLHWMNCAHLNFCGIKKYPFVLLRNIASEPKMYLIFQSNQWLLILNLWVYLKDSTETDHYYIYKFDLSTVHTVRDYSPQSSTLITVLTLATLVVFLCFLYFSFVFCQTPLLYVFCHMGKTGKHRVTVSSSTFKVVRQHVCLCFDFYAFTQPKLKRIQKFLHWEDQGHFPHPHWTILPSTLQSLVYILYSNHTFPKTNSTEFNTRLKSSVFRPFCFKISSLLRCALLPVTTNSRESTYVTWSKVS